MWIPIKSGRTTNSCCQFPRYHCTSWEHTESQINCTFYKPRVESDIASKCLYRTGDTFCTSQQARSREDVFVLIRYLRRAIDQSNNNSLCRMLRNCIKGVKKELLNFNDRNEKCNLPGISGESLSACCHIPFYLCTSGQHPESQINCTFYKPGAEIDLASECLYLTGDACNSQQARSNEDAVKLFNNLLGATGLSSNNSFCRMLRNCSEEVKKELFNFNKLKGKCNLYILSQRNGKRSLSILPEPDATIDRKTKQKIQIYRDVYDYVIRKFQQEKLVKTVADENVAAEYRIATCKARGSEYYSIRVFSNGTGEFHYMLEWYPQRKIVTDEKKSLSVANVMILTAAIEKYDFFNIPTIRPNAGFGSSDGQMFYIEGYRDNKFHFIARPGIKPGEYGIYEIHKAFSDLWSKLNPDSEV